MDNGLVSIIDRLFRWALENSDLISVKVRDFADKRKSLRSRLSVHGDPVVCQDDDFTLKWRYNGEVFDTHNCTLLRISEKEPLLKGRDCYYVDIDPPAKVFAGKYSLEDLLSSHEEGKHQRLLTIVNYFTSHQDKDLFGKVTDYRFVQEIAKKIFRFRGQPITDSLETRKLKNWVITDGYNSIITVPILTDKDTLVGCLAIEQEVRKEIKRTPYRDLKDRVGLALTWPKVLLKLAFSKSYRTEIRAEMERQQSRIKMKEGC